MKLGNYFAKEHLIRNGDFQMLGHVACQQPGLLAYCESIHYVRIANQNPNISCILTNESLATNVDKGKGLVIENEPRNIFYQLHKKLIENDLGIYKVDKRIGNGCKIHFSAHISANCQIGNNVIINENVVIGDGVTIGDDVFIDVGAVLGAEGILFITINGNNERIPHGGGVKVGNGVTILSNAVVVKSIHPSQLTIIKDYSIIGIASNIGHEAVVGRNCVVSGNCVIARGANIDDNVIIGTSSVIREYLKLGHYSEIKAGSIVVKNVQSSEKVSGNFAISHSKHLQEFVKARG